MRQYYGNSGGMQRGINWRDALETIKAGRDELDRYGGIMTQYEYQVAKRDVRELTDTHRPAIMQGITAEWEAVIQGYQEKARKVERERTAEVNRWEAGKLASEMQVVSMLVDQALKNKGTVMTTRNLDAAGEMERIYQDAKQSGDLHRRRAAAEIIRNVSQDYSGDQETRRKMNLLAVQAESDLNQLRVTNEMTAAEAELSASWDAILEKREEVRRVAVIIGEGDPGGPLAGGELAHQLRRVQRDRFTNEVKIYGYDDPEISPVIIRGISDGAGD